MTGGGRGGGSGGAEALSAVGAGGQAAVSPAPALMAQVLVRRCWKQRCVCIFESSYVGDLVCRPSSGLGLEEGLEELLKGPHPEQTVDPAAQ